MKNIFSVQYVLMLVLLSGLYSCGSIKPVSIKGIENFRPGSTLSKPEFTFDIAIENPNKFGVTVQRMGVNLSLNDSAIAGINIPGKTRIGAGAVISVPVTIQPSVQTMTSLVMGGLKNIFSENKKQRIEIKGEIAIRKFIFVKKIKIREAIKL
jgi:LEA14-like dessication related protein